MTRENMTQVWISVKALPHWRRHGSWLQWAVSQVTMLDVNATARLWHRWKIPMTEVWNHLNLQVCEVWCKFYSYLALNIFTDDVNYDYFWCGLWLFFTWFITFDVDYDYFWRGLWWSLSLFMSMWCITYPLIIRGLISRRENQQFEFNKNWRGLRCTWVVLFYLRKMWLTRIHHLCQAMSRRLNKW